MSDRNQSRPNYHDDQEGDSFNIHRPPSIAVSELSQDFRPDSTYTPSLFSVDDAEGPTGHFGQQSVQPSSHSARAQARGVSPPTVQVPSATTSFVSPFSGAWDTLHPGASPIDDLADYGVRETGDLSFGQSSTSGNQSRSVRLPSWHEVETSMVERRDDRFPIGKSVYDLSTDFANHNKRLSYQLQSFESLVAARAEIESGKYPTDLSFQNTMPRARFQPEDQEFVEERIKRWNEIDSMQNGADKSAKINDWDDEFDRGLNLSIARARRLYQNQT